MFTIPTISSLLAPRPGNSNHRTHHGRVAFHLRLQVERIAHDAKSFTPSRFQPSGIRDLKALRYQEAAARTAAAGKDDDRTAARAPFSGMVGSGTVLERPCYMVGLVKVCVGKRGFGKGQMIPPSRLGLGLVSGGRVREWVFDYGYSALLLPLNVVGVGKGIRKSRRFRVAEDWGNGGICARCSWIRREQGPGPGQVGGSRTVRCRRRQGCLDPSLRRGLLSWFVLTISCFFVVASGDRWRP